MPGVLGAVASPRQPASRSRAPLREAWAFLLGVLVQGTAERWGEPLGRVAGHKFSSSTSWGRVRGSPPPRGALRARSSRAHTHRTHTAHSKSRPRPGRKGTPGHPGSRVLPLGKHQCGPLPTHAAGPAEGEQSCGETTLTSYQRGSQVPTVGRRGEPGQLPPAAMAACACSAP